MMDLQPDYRFGSFLLKTVRINYQSSSGPQVQTIKIIRYQDGYNLVSVTDTLSKGEIVRLGGTTEQAELFITDTKRRLLGDSCEFCGDLPTKGEVWDTVIPVCDACSLELRA